jgi:hypothetical protein
VPTESAAYQDAAHGTALEQLVEALPYCETVEDFTCVVEDYLLEMVEDAIAMQDTQPRRLLLTEWLANATTKPLEQEAGVQGAGGKGERISFVRKSPAAMPRNEVEQGSQSPSERPPAPPRPAPLPLIEPVLPSFKVKVGDILKRLRGYSKGQVAQVLQVFQDWLETSLGAVSFNEIESGSWQLIGST